MRAALLAASLAWAAVPAWAGPRAAVESLILSRAENAGGLDQAQTTKLRDAWALYHANVERLRQRFRDQLKGLDAKVKANAPAAELDASLAQLEKTYRAILDERAKFAEGTRRYLTPGQRAKIAIALSGKKLKRAP